MSEKVFIFVCLIKAKLMKFKLFLLMLTANIVGFSQFHIKPAGKEIAIKYERGKTNKLKVDAPVKVILKISSEVNKTVVEVKGYENIVSLLRISAHDGELMLEYKSKKVPRSQDYPVVNITMPSIKRISVMRAAELVCISPLILQDLDVFVSGASSVKLPIVDAKYLSLNVSGASDIKIIDLKKAKKLSVILSGASDVFIQKGGNVENAEVSVSGASDLKMRNVPVKSMKIAIAGASDAYIKAVDVLDITASGSSDVFVYGKPKQLNKVVSGQSNVIVK